MVNPSKVKDIIMSVDQGTIQWQRNAKNRVFQNPPTHM